ncbi:hypothetical protein I6G82_05525 [Lysinibacillus macroides]|uniref:hypothetical protein n=1 Tax=Lysinibacillus macroides TaxID=33935 RepID=UPI0006B5874C|nr:hypothetical protein [Lysinibacillus macroides]QPR69075.1 hypothetical protein I6G82_05525 [Lysinibacillus macroides]
MDKGEFHTLVNMLSEMQEGLKELKITVDKLEVKVDKLEAKVDKLETKVDSQSEKLDKLEAKVDNQGVKLDRLEAKVEVIMQQTAKNTEMQPQLIETTKLAKKAMFEVELLKNYLNN